MRPDTSESLRQQYRERSEERMQQSMLRLATAVSRKEPLPALPPDSGTEESFVKYRCGGGDDR